MTAAFIQWYRNKRVAAKLLRIQTFIEKQRECHWGTTGKWVAFDAVDRIRRDVLYGKEVK